MRTRSVKTKCRESKVREQNEVKRRGEARGSESGRGRGKKIRQKRKKAGIKKQRRQKMIKLISEQGRIILC